MPRPVYSTRFISTQGYGGNAPYLVPTGKVAVVRDIWVYSGNQVGPSAFYFAGQLGQKLWAIENPPLTPMFWYWQGRQVFYAGETFTLNVVAGIFDMTCSGYLLDNP